MTNQDETGFVSSQRGVSVGIRDVWRVMTATDTIKLDRRIGLQTAAAGSSLLALPAGSASHHQRCGCSASREEEGPIWVCGRLPSNTKVNNFGEGPAVIDPVAGVVPRPVGVEAAT